MEGDAGDFHDWELLHGSDSPTSVHTLRNFEEIEDVSEGMIQADYFSLDGSSRYAKRPVSEEDCDSDNPSWVDPVPGGYETQFPRKDSGVFWSDSGSDHSDEHRKIVDFDARGDVKEPVAVQSEKTGELVTTKDVSLGFGYDESKLTGFDVENEIIDRGFGDLGEIKPLGQDSGKDQFWSDPGGDELGEVNKFDEHEPPVEPKVCNSQSGGELEDGEIEKVKVGNCDEKRRVVWWKVPFELLRYCVLRVSPVWSFSVAAAVIGFVILGRRLYRMKHKSRTLQLKVTLDDKKVSQFMTRAARLNEAFSVVRRVPMIRPALPATGVTQWPVMSLR